MQTRSGKMYTTHGSNVPGSAISNQLAKFLGKPAGSKMRRTEVLRDIENYVDTNNLIDNEARIKPDRKLAAIIKMGENRELTYFNLLKHLNHHFV